MVKDDTTADAAFILSELRTDGRNVELLLWGRTMDPARSAPLRFNLGNRPIVFVGVRDRGVMLLWLLLLLLLLLLLDEMGMFRGLMPVISAFRGVVTRLGIDEECGRRGATSCFDEEEYDDDVDDDKGSAAAAAAVVAATLLSSDFAVLENKRTALLILLLLLLLLLLLYTSAPRFITIAIIMA